MSVKAPAPDRASLYIIEIVGELGTPALNPSSPYEFTRVDAGETTTTFSVTCDQAGLIGVLRYLHGLALVIQSVDRASTAGTG
jgi:hypothetical protein